MINGASRLRKTVATLMDDAGLPARALADQLGHSKPSMTTGKFGQTDFRRS
jgi:integrase